MRVGLIPSRGDTRGSFDALGHQFGQVHDFHPGLALFLGLDGEHLHAKWAAGGQSLDAGAAQLPVAVFRHPLGALFLFFPELSAASAAAEGVLAPALGFGELDPSRLQNLTGGVENPVVPAQVTGVVEGGLAQSFGGDLNLALFKQLLEELAVVADIVMAAEILVVVANGVEAVRAGSYNRLVAHRFVESFDISLGHLGKKVLVAGPARGVAGAALLGT